MRGVAAHQLVDEMLHSRAGPVFLRDGEADHKARLGVGRRVARPNPVHLADPLDARDVEVFARLGPYRAGPTANNSGRHMPISSHLMIRDRINDRKPPFGDCVRGSDSIPMFASRTDHLNLPANPIMGS